MTPEELVEAVEAFVAEASEGGRRAQAVVAGLMDLFADPSRVDVKRVNDPSRTAPGDVVVRRDAAVERSFEVRDKAVTREDLYHFATKIAEAGHSEAIMVAVSASQPKIPLEEVRHWARERGVALSVFLSWRDLISQVLLWAPAPTLDAASRAPELIRARLQQLEVEPATLEAWIARFSAD